MNNNYDSYDLGYIRRCRKERDPANFFVFYDDRIVNEDEIRVYYVLENEEFWFFRIEKGVPLSPELETLLLMVLNEEEALNPDGLSDINSIYAAIKFGLPFWSNCSLYGRIARLYFAFCRRDHYLELLAKTDLYHIFHAALVGAIREINERGRNFPEIFGLSAKVMRYFNHPDTVSYLKTAERREVVAQIYSRFHYLLRGQQRPLTRIQVQYLFENRFSKISARAFQRISYESEIDRKMFDSYMKIYARAKKCYPSLPSAPSRDELPFCHKKATIVCLLLDHEEFLNNFLDEKTSNLDLTGCTILSTVREYISVSARFRNCLYEYPVRMPFGTVGFVCILGDDICIELAKTQGGYHLSQALTKDNNTLSDDQEQRLDVFCQQNNIDKPKRKGILPYENFYDEH